MYNFAIALVNEEIITVHYFKRKPISPLDSPKLIRINLCPVVAVLEKKGRVFYLGHLALRYMVEFLWYIVDYPFNLFLFFYKFCDGLQRLGGSAEAGSLSGPAF